MMLPAKFSNSEILVLWETQQQNKKQKSGIWNLTKGTSVWVKISTDFLFLCDWKKSTSFANNIRPYFLF